ncbi:DinB family protein [Candidatus Thorarchaeota archaeon]|nr:MAG: DinB family protein [Candidatus Thorarchaeota archaeon]
MPEENHLVGLRGNLLRLGLGARNWLLSQLMDDITLLSWEPPDGGRSVSEILEHISWTVSIVCSKIADDYGIRLEEMDEPSDQSDYESFAFPINSAYDLFKQLCTKLDDSMMAERTTLPPPARLREGTVETILRVMGGFHTVHHAGQVALTLRRAKDAIENMT